MKILFLIFGINTILLGNVLSQEIECNFITRSNVLSFDKFNNNYTENDSLKACISLYVILISLVSNFLIKIFEYYLVESINTEKYDGIVTQIHKATDINDMELIIKTQVPHQDGGSNICATYEDYQYRFYGHYKY